MLAFCAILHIESFINYFKVEQPQYDAECKKGKENHINYKID